MHWTVGRATLCAPFLNQLRRARSGAPYHRGQEASFRYTA